MKVLQTIASDLNGQPQKNGSYLSRCPAHDYPNPTLSLFKDENGLIRFHCQAGCSEKEVRAAHLNMVVQSGDDTKSMLEQDEAQLSKKAEVNRAELKQRAKKAVFTALKVWQAAERASCEHPYLLRKQISPVATLRQIKLAGLIDLIGYIPEANGEEFTDGDILLVPVFIENEISTLEFIDADGRKSTLAYGKKKGGYWPTEKLPPVMQSGDTLLIVVGVVNTLFLKRTSDLPHVAVLSSDDLLSVARLLRKRYPQAELVITIDLKKNAESSDFHALAAAREVQGRIVLFGFREIHPRGLTDFNDSSVQLGQEALQPGGTR